MPHRDERKENGRKRHPLTRERVVQAALHLMDEEGLDAVTMRRVGRELGVEAMSLYNHVRDKEDLLDGITEAVMAEYSFEPSSSGDWFEQARRAASGWRRLLKRHPNVIRLLVERDHPLAAEAALWPMEIALDILRRAGLSARESVRAFRAIGSFIFGHVMMEVGNVTPMQGGDTELVPELVLHQIPVDRFPRFVEALPEIATCRHDETFEFGLDLLLEGIRAKAAASQA